MFGRDPEAGGRARSFWFLPAGQSLYITESGPVMMQENPLISGAADAPPVDRDALIAALRTDQAGNSTFPEFLAASWRAGIVRDDVDCTARTVSYYGCNGEECRESYPAAELKQSS